MRRNVRHQITRSLRELIVTKASTVNGGFLHIPMGVPVPRRHKPLPPVRDDRAR